MSKPNATLQSLFDYLKPHRAEAILRLRINTTCLLFFVMTTSLLPVPSVTTAWKVLRKTRQWWFYEWICLLEITILCILLFNVTQCAYAIKYPRTPLPPFASPAKLKPAKISPNSSRAFKALSPNTSPQVQKSFSASFSQSTYPSSPVSTPTRVMHYSIPASAGSPSASRNELIASGSGPQLSPSPVLSAYRGRHAGGIGRSFDGFLLSRLGTEASDDSESGGDD